MGINHDAFGNSEGHTEDYVRGFSRRARKPQQLCHRLRYLAAEFFDQHLAGTLDGFGLVTKKPGRANVLLKFIGGNFEIVFWLAVLPKEIGRNDINPLVRALRRQDRGNQKLEWI